MRMISGVLVLVAIVLVRGKPNFEAGNWPSGLMLFTYAIAFSFAYVGLKAGTGALILFGSVQATMIIAAILGKQRPGPFEWAGLGLALAGLVYLLMPGLSAPPLDRAGLMMIAGIAWGIYSLRGRSVTDPIDATASNFLKAVIPALLVSMLAKGAYQASPHGLLLACLSGAVTSGIGYVIWYSALPSLGATRAAVVQLLVPIIAAAGGALLLSEPLTLRLGIAAGVTLSGVALAVFGKSRATGEPVLSNPRGETSGSTTNKSTEK